MEEPTRSTNFFLRIIQNHYTVTPNPKSECQIQREKWLIPRCLPFNRWCLMPAAFIIQFCCGSMYSWSVFNIPIDMLIYNENRNMAPITFYIAVGFLGLAAALMGPWLEQHGPFQTCALGTTLFFTGNLTTALALYLKQIWLVFLGYGVICGLGLGICYISPVSALQKWFPDKRGLASGLAVCGFGAGSIVISKVQIPLIHLVGLPLTFAILGSIYFSLMIICACFLRTPPPNFNPISNSSSQSEMSEQNSVSVKVNEQSDGSLPFQNSAETQGIPEMTLLEAISSTDFRLIMVMFSANIIFGLVLVSRFSNIITQVFSKSPEEASTVVAVNGGFNLGGRLLVGLISDYVGRKNCFVAMLSAQLVILGCFSTMTTERAYLPFIISMWVVTAIYGSSFGVIPAFLSDKFGSKNIGVCHGIVLTGWSFAGIVGGLIFTAVFEAILRSGYKDSDHYPYNINVWWLFGVLCIGWVALLFIKPTKQDEKLLRKIKRIFTCCNSKNEGNFEFNKS